MTYRTLRRDIIELVLATDMNKHFEQLQLFKTYLPGVIQYYSAQVPLPFHFCFVVCYASKLFCVLKRDILLFFRQKLTVFYILCFESSRNVTPGVSKLVPETADYDR